MSVGAEGSAGDSAVLKNSPLSSLEFIPEGYYLLGDAGYGLQNKLLVPYRGVPYHKNDWKKVLKNDWGDPIEKREFKSKEEIYNFHHSQLRIQVCHQRFHDCVYLASYLCRLSVLLVF